MTTANIGHPFYICNTHGVYRQFHFPEKFRNRRVNQKNFFLRRCTSPIGVKCGFCFSEKFSDPKRYFGKYRERGWALLSTTPRLPHFTAFCISRHYTHIHPILIPYIRRSFIPPTVTHPLPYHYYNAIKTARTLCTSPYRERGFCVSCGRVHHFPMI